MRLHCFTAWEIESRIMQDIEFLLSVQLDILRFT